MTWTRSCLLAALLAVPALVALAEDKPQPGERPSVKTAKLDRAALEKQFAEKMSGVVLVGAFTVVGKSDVKPPKAERYEISEVSKLRDNFWMFHARIKYRQADVTVPIVLKVLWAGDTPIISLTDLTIPGLGSALTARVMFHGDQYAGIWQHGKAGGHMFGKLKKAKPADKRKKNNATTNK